MSPPFRLMLYEPGCQGHPIGWIRYLLHVFAEKDRDLALDLAAPPQVQSSLVADVAAARDAGREVKVLSLPPAAGRPEELLSLLVRHKPDGVLFLELTPWERWLAHHPLPCTVAGILFVQYPEIDPSCGPLLQRMERWLRRQVKEHRTARWLRLQQWRAVFLLNGERACRYLNQRFSKTPVFRPIPDPIPPPEIAGEEGGAPPQRRTRLRFLHLGVLSARKGMHIGLRALEYVSPEWAKACEVRIVGAVEAHYKSVFQSAVQELRRRRPDIQMTWEERYLSEKEFESELAATNWLWLPYLRTEYSSGILAHAARWGKPVLGPSDGLIGHLITHHSLGRVCTIEPRALAAALEQAYREPFVADETQRVAFVHRSSPAVFAQSLLDVFTPS